MLNISWVIGLRDRLSFSTVSGVLRHCTVKLYLYCLNYVTTYIRCELWSIMGFPDTQVMIALMSSYFFGYYVRVANTNQL